MFPSEADYQRAVDLLVAGELVGMPTETVYGLGADAANPAAVAKIFAAKGRPADHPLIVHLAGHDAVDHWAEEVPAVAWELMETFWPGPLTLILKKQAWVPDAVTGGQDTVGLRVPGHPVALELLRRFARAKGEHAGIAAPSANRFGRISPTTAEHVAEELGARVPLILDGGPCKVGIESTIIDLSTGTLRLLRPGAITADDLERTVGEPVELLVDPSIRSPGRMALHYAPNARVVLASMEEVAERLAEYAIPGVHVGVLSEKRAPSWPAHIPWLPLGNSASEQAQQLYRRLRQADGMGLAALIVVPPGDRGMGHALRDRLWRAAGLGAVLA